MTSKKANRLRRRWDSLKWTARSAPWPALIVAALLAALSGAVSDSVIAVVGAISGPPSVDLPDLVLALGGSLLILVFVFILYWRRTDLLGFGALGQEEDPEGHRALVLHLSTSNQWVTVRDLTGNLLCDVEWRSQHGDPPESPEMLALPSDPREARTAITDHWANGGRWNWEQLVRALEPHASSLRYVCLMGSSDKENRDGTQGSSDDSSAERGSYGHEDAAKELLGHLLGEDVEFTSKEVDFEDVRNLMAEISDGIRALREMARANDEFLSDDDIMIDVTGGQKTASASAAVVTLNSHIKFQYVPPSSDSDRSVRYYNVIRRHPEDL